MPFSKQYITFISDLLINFEGFQDNGTDHPGSEGMPGLREVLLKIKFFSYHIIFYSQFVSIYP